MRLFLGSLGLCVSMAVIGCGGPASGPAPATTNALAPPAECVFEGMGEHPRELRGDAPLKCLQAYDETGSLASATAGTLCELRGTLQRPATYDCSVRLRDGSRVELMVDAPGLGEGDGYFLAKPIPAIETRQAQRAKLDARIRKIKHAAPKEEARRRKPAVERNPAPALCPSEFSRDGKMEASGPGYDATVLEGLPIYLAEGRARKADCELRVLDGPLTEDLRFTRINVEVEHGVVTKVDGIY